ncbi:baseplate J/gp47 family protein [Fusobacterium sp. SYSU M8A802]
MFEDKTFEKLLEKKLKSIPSEIDKREGSIVYDATAGNSLETAQMYITISEYYKETFGHTASRENLIKRASERGIYPKPASAGVYKGVFNIQIPLGSRFSLNEYNYIVIKKLDSGSYEYQLECETLGEEPNGNTGTLVPIEYIDGLISAELTEILIPGEDEEDTESLRVRYLNSFDTQAYGGNIKDYEEKTLAISGVGAVKVTPVWKGGGTVRLTILNSEYDEASSALVEKVQETIDPTKDGSGKGIAPIGHIVTVDTPQKKSIYIATNLTLENIEISNIRDEINRVLQEYLLELRKNWASSNKVVVRISQIETRILTVNNKIIDISGTKINGKEENLEIDIYEIPVWGSGNYVGS